jgi:uncharacterized protein YkwD
MLVVLGIFFTWLLGGWLVRTLYWYQQGTAGERSWQCPNCQRERHRAVGSWVPACGWCGWKPGSVLTRWLLYSVPMRQLRRTVFRGRTAGFAVVVCLLVGLAGTGVLGVGVLQPNEQAPSGDGRINATEIEDRIVERINDQRTDRGLVPLERRDEIDAVATAHTRDMHDRNFNGHVNPDGEDPQDRLADVDICRQDGAVHGSENYAWMDIAEEVYPDETTAVYDTRSTEGLTFAFMDWWNNSRPHRTNQRDPDWRYIGVGVIVEDGRGKATVNFC